MRTLIVLVLLLVNSTAFAFTFAPTNNSLEPNFLPVEQAFKVSVDAPQNGIIKAHWLIHDGYYLYQNRLSLSGPQADKLHFAALPKGEDKTDKYFGDVIVYKHNLSIPIYYDITLPAGTKIKASLHYQGCAEKGLCYAPQVEPIEFTVPPVEKKLSALNSEQTKPSIEHKTPSPVISKAPEFSPSEASSISHLLASSSLWTAIAALFGFGLLLSLTPCVLPMIPIVSAIVVGTRRSKLGAFYYSVVYVLAMALTYGAIGAIAGVFGTQLNLQAQLQSPILLGISAALFIALALAMFGVYELRLPLSWQNRLQQSSNPDTTSSIRTTLHTFIAGVLATLIVSPCVSAPVAGILLFISSQGDIWYGALMLFVMALGMGIPLLLVGLFGPKVLPKNGPWLHDTKVIMGFTLLAVSIWLATRWLPAITHLILWAALAFAISAYFLHRATSSYSHPVRWFCALFFGVIGAFELYGAASGATNPLKPIVNNQQGIRSESIPLFKTTISGLTELPALLANQDPRPIMLDLYADWCISCKVMEEEIFKADDVRPLIEKVQLVRVDVTKNTPENKALMAKFALFGPPSLVFLDAQGNEQKDLTLIGEPTKAEVLTRLQFFVKNN
ncbi:protein-disulfide reductase DsbD [Marinomonas pollencensis]|uniref:Thiol:disulfide interchange protein DsbD n=1 Tax=Marinomonas pollencensis TaxID=491954 RepID=A0A3E0DR07_9GAMM|nr:protein-disulfide reductase DsbD [Marinomonas pollencensis]REG84311.1 thiol:disulfide interchange protein DsbD [Marinomonas pollencensis]